MSYALETISPELALVSPDLARRAREELLDRPWEAFLPAPKAPALRLAPVATATAPQAPAAPVAAPVSRRRFRPPLGLTLLVGFAGLVLAGSVLPSRDVPTLGPPPSAPAATTPAPRVTARPAAATPAVPRTPLRRGLASVRPPRRISL